MSASPETPATPRTILIVDDDHVLRARLGKALRDRGLEVREAASAGDALVRAREDSPELALVDLRMPGASGLELIAELRAIDPTTQVVVLTGYGSIATAVEAVRRGAVHYLTKPADADEVLAAFERGEGKPSSVEYTTPSLARVEWEHIQRVLTDCGGNVSHAARKLGIHRRSLQRKLSKAPASR
jgi:two-component system response regulator RegA